MPAELGKIELAPGRDLVMLERQFAVQDLNARYAEAIDDDRLEEWPEFFRPDGRYHITTAENLAQGFPIGIVSATSRAMLRDRIKALRQANVYEAQRYRHVLGTPRIVARNARPRMRRSVIGTDLALATIVAALCWLIGWPDFLLVWAPAALLAGAAGIWLFYVQHQFEHTYWQRSQGWSYTDAALRGSSYLKLPQPLQFITGNIGLHHVHHMSARIPNYNLQRAHDENPIFHEVPTLSLWDGLRAVRLKLWDERSRRLVTFAQARATRA